MGKGRPDMMHSDPARPFASPIFRQMVSKTESTASTPSSVYPVASFTGPMVVTEDATYTYYTLTGDGDLTFDRASSVEVEINGGGGGGGGTQYGSGAGGGGAGARFVRLASVATGTTYPVSVGAGGAGGVPGTSGAAPGGASTAFGITAAGGGGGGTRNVSTTGQNGGCGGGNHSSKDASNGSYGRGSFGGSGAGGSSPERVGGGGGGMGGDATFITKYARVGSVASPSLGGQGLPSLLPGVTVCSGGRGGRKINPGHGAPGVNPGDGGSGAGSTNNIMYDGGAGANGQVVIRVPKSGPALALSIDEAGMDTDADGVYRQDPVGWGYALRATLDSADIPVRGTLTGGAMQIEARVLDADDNEIVGWTALGIPSDGVPFDYSISVPASGLEHRLEARVRSRPSVFYRQRVLWHTAYTVTGYGQSNWLHAQSQTGDESPTDFPEDSFFVVIGDGTPSYPEFVKRNAQLGSGVFTLIRDLRAQLGLPVMVVTGGQGGASVGILADPENPSMMAMVSGLDASRGTNAILYSQGEGNATGEADMAVYASLLSSIRSQFTAAAGPVAGDVPIIISPICTQAVYESSGWMWIKNMQKDYLPANLANCYCAAPWDDAVRYDNFHCYSESYARRLAREARLIAYLVGFDTDPGEFRIASVAATDATTTTVTVSHNNIGNDIELITTPHGSGDGIVDPAASINSFEVTVDGWTTVVPTTAVRTDATTITLTHAAIATSGRRLRYFYGARPGYESGTGFEANGVVRDNSAFHYPLQYESDLPAS
jgi:hypothetical protein